MCKTGCSPGAKTQGEHLYSSNLLETPQRWTGKEKHDKEGMEPNKAMVCTKHHGRPFSADFTGKFPSARFVQNCSALKSETCLTHNLSVFVSLAKNCT